ncbi:MAG: DUF3303 domain-containing protein [Acidobacteria bacterium]|nr:DUF3303 domain-containing protein [Acidobacteriota bacterium]
MRFLVLETGGAPPESVKMLGRWHGSGMGYVLAETSVAKALYKWVGRWQDLLRFAATPGHGRCGGCRNHEEDHCITASARDSTAGSSTNGMAPGFGNRLERCDIKA